MRFCARIFAPFVVLAALCLSGEEVKAQDRVSMIGKFVRPGQAGLVFIPDMEKNVEYLPLGMSQNPEDYLNILVKVTGKAGQAFARGETTVRALDIEKIEPMTGEYGNTKISKAPYHGVVGSEPVEIHAYEDHTCYLYKDYAVFSTVANYTEGFNLAVAKRLPSDDPAALCENPDRPAVLLIPNQGASRFYGLAAPWLFIEDGTGPEPHDLLVYDLEQKSGFKHASAPFFSPATLTDGRYLEMSSLDPKSGKRENLRIDLKTGGIKAVK